jgi:hypothetical protein
MNCFKSTEGTVVVLVVSCSYTYYLPSALPRHKQAAHCYWLSAICYGRKKLAFFGNWRNLREAESGLGSYGDPVTTYPTTTRRLNLFVSPPGPSQPQNKITPTAREFRGLESIRERPNLCKRPDYHYDQRTDQNVPESIPGFFNVSNHGGYNQRDTNCVRQIYERILEGMMRDRIKTIQTKVKGKSEPYAPHHDRQGRESQNNADYIAHFPIVRAHLPSLNEQITLTAREFRRGSWSWIRSRKLQPHYKIKYHLHYNECTDKNIPEYRFRFFKIASHKGYSQWDAEAVSDKPSYAVQFPMSFANQTEMAKRQHLVQEVQGYKAQNNADCNNHAPIIGVRSSSRNYGVIPTAREVRGIGGHHGS